MAGADIEFWFDFSSGYAYFASLRIGALAEKHGRRVLWRPFLLGTAFKATGMRGLSSTPLRGDYARHDWARLARRAGVTFAPPAAHPITALPASRLFYWLEERDPAEAVAWARRAFDVYYCDGVDLSTIEIAADLAAAQTGRSATELAAGATSDAIKARTRARSEEAVARGIFGSPLFVVDGEPFWGADRLPMIDDWLSVGGW